jgi:hypothetical protein
MDVGDVADMPGFVVGDGQGKTSSVANSLQDFSANPEEKFDCWRKKFCPWVIFPFWRNLAEEKIFFFCVSVEITIFLGHFPRIKKDKRRETILLQIRPFWPFSAHFVQNQPKNRRQNFPAASLFIQPFLTYAAEQSASWQHCQARHRSSQMNPWVRSV